MQHEPWNETTLKAPRSDRYTANQPLFFPLLYMMDRFQNVSHLVIMEEAQFSKFGHQARTQIRTKNGEQHLTLPLKNRSFRPLNEIQVDQFPRFWRKFTGTLQTVYGKYEAYRALRPSLDELGEDLQATWERAPEAVTAAYMGEVSMMWCMMACGIRLPLVHRSMDLIPERPEDATAWIAEFGTELSCTEYLGGGAAMKNYIKPEVFDQAGIRLVSQEYASPGYEGVAGRVGTGMVSVLDPLLVGGPELVQELLGAHA